MSLFSLLAFVIAGLASEWEVIQQQDIITNADEAVAYLNGSGGLLAIACDDQVRHPVVSFTPDPPAIGLWSEPEATVWIRFSSERSPAEQVWLSYRGSVYARPENNYLWLLSKLRNSETVGLRVISRDDGTSYDALFELEGSDEAISQVLQYC
jgi:hypothetical protein